MSSEDSGECRESLATGPDNWKISESWRKVHNIIAGKQTV